MIQIICGTYGKKEGSRVVAKTAQSAPFALPDAEEARLVGLGVAKYAKAPEDQAQDAARLTKIPEYNADMKADTLRAMGEAYGLKFKTVMSKADMVAALDNYFSEALEERDEAE